MSTLHDHHPSMDVPKWEPEPLHLPLDDVPVDDRYHRDRRHRSGGDQPERDVPGSHVIVIDLA